MVASLFETHAAIVDAAGTTTRGDRSIGCGCFVRPGGHYCPEPREIVQAADIALVLGPQTIDVLRRGRDARWRFIISFWRENDVRSTEA